MIVTFLGGIVSLKLLAVFVKGKVRDDQGCVTGNQLQLVLPIWRLYDYGYLLNWKKVNPITSFGSKMVHRLTGISRYAIG
ncbi:hypothetical protein TNCV_3502121 [Trichonephila clavipes]|uniref:Uncharacterized protein n=1 Tax=Trichonephila clavipes TaxID=2585209 RepID=A0A8X6VDP7_TRICX|nr:hypothetical protein TNCV_3502121 [Trichonephila clavipes]